MSKTTIAANAVLTSKGYAVVKSSLTPGETEAMKKALTVVPRAAPGFAAKISPFRVYLESSSRWYLPRSWAEKRYGIAAGNVMSAGQALREDLVFVGKPRDHQIAAMKEFHDANNCGILCLPCGYGKTFTAIAIAAKLKKRFLVVVHKEFLVDQWSGELRTLLPGVRIGRIQGERCDIGEEFDVSIAMIQTICSRSYPNGTFQGFGLAIFDEAHHLGAEHFSQTLQRIQCTSMLGLTATPARTDGLTKVFEWFLGPIVFKIEKRESDKTVGVEVLRYSADDPVYADPPLDYKGDVVRARMINQIAEYAPRTTAILDWIVEHLRNPARKLLILSDRREHLIAFDEGLKKRGIHSVGFYVGGMKQKDLDKSALCQVLLGTFAMASEGFNVPTLNTILLATPKSNVEQSVGRVLRQRPEERAVPPLILDVLDAPFVECHGQWNKRQKFYKQCGYKIQWYSKDKKRMNTSESEKDESDEDEPESRGKKCLIVDKECCDSVCSECIKL